MVVVILNSKQTPRSGGVELAVILLGVERFARVKVETILMRLFVAFQ